MLERRAPGALERKSLGYKRLVTRQVKRLVLSGVFPTIQQQRELFLAFHTWPDETTSEMLKSGDSWSLFLVLTGGRAKRACVQIPCKGVALLLDCWNDTRQDPAVSLAQ